MTVGAAQQSLPNRMMRGQVQTRRDLGMAIDTEPRAGARSRETRAREAPRRSEMPDLGVVRIMAARAEKSDPAMGGLGPVEMGPASALVTIQAVGIVGKPDRLGRSRSLDMERPGAMAVFAVAVIRGSRLMPMTALAAVGAEPFGCPLHGRRALVAGPIRASLETGAGSRTERESDHEPQHQQAGTGGPERAASRLRADALRSSSPILFGRQGISRSDSSAQRILASRALKDAPFSSM